MPVLLASPEKPAPLILCEIEQPWVQRADHLGVTLHEDGELCQDCYEKRAQFIDTSAQIRSSYGTGHCHREILYKPARSKSLGFDQHGGSEDLQCMENGD